MNWAYLLIINFVPLLEVCCQSVYPYLSFMGQTLANHSFVHLGTIGIEDTSSLHCVTDLGTCCSSTQGSHRGDWYFPDGTRLPFGGHIHEIRSAQNVQLRRASGAASSSGIYRCDIPTLSVHDDDDISVRDHVYVGVYAANQGIASRILLKMKLVSLNIEYKHMIPLTKSALTHFSS